MIDKILISLLTGFILALNVHAADPTATNYTFDECRGSAMPYVVPSQAVNYPDTLTPVFINHIGRHGARFLSSPRKAVMLSRELNRADSLKTITPLGKRLKAFTEYIIAISDGRWGALDSLGMDEQRGIASRMYASYPELFRGKIVDAVSSYVPRCIMSMYEFTHQLSRLDNKVEIYTASGRQNSRLLRFFDNDPEYREAVKSQPVSDAYRTYETKMMTLAPLKRVLGDGFPYGDDAGDIAMAEYSVLAGTAAMGLECNLADYFRPEEINALWSINNLGQYLQRTATTLTTLPAEIASPLLRELVVSTDAAVNGENKNHTVMLRFGHAETLMPLLSLMRLPGCWYLTNYFDTVGLNWKNFHVVPMASNLQMIIFKSDSGRHYVRFDLNESPVKLRNNLPLYLSWDEARNILIEECLPLWEQP